jgi:ubiquinone/menaquinone biosynthesis C-methylase UbiE
MINKHNSPPPVVSSARLRFHAWLLTRSPDDFHRSHAPRTEELLRGMSGTVVEIGPGAGRNLRYFSPDVRWIGIEPNPFLHPAISAEATARRINFRLIRGTAENLDLEDRCADAVVGTLVLCSVKEPTRALSEFRRVLKPGGRYYFMEHVIAPEDTLLRGLQRVIRPVWQAIGNGCTPDRDSLALIKQAGFSIVHAAMFRTAVPVVAPHIAGYAVR